MSDGDLTLRHHLLDPNFWRPRLRALERAPRKLVMAPRPDLSRPGIEVLGLRVRGHDGRALSALLGRSAFARRGDFVRVRPAWPGHPEVLDWASLQDGGTDVVLLPFADEQRSASIGEDGGQPGRAVGRRLEDRVLDVIRLAEVACSIESVPCGAVRFGWGRSHECEDAFTLAALIRDQGWLDENCRGPHGAAG